MPTICIGFSTVPTGTFSRLIRWATNSKVSHCFEWISNEQIFEAESPDTHYKTPAQFFKEGNKIIDLFYMPISQAQWEINKKLRVELLGHKYGWAQIAGFSWKVLSDKLFGKKTDNKVEDGKRTQICVELCCRLLGLVSVSEEWSPEDLYQYCQKNGIRHQP